METLAAPNASSVLDASTVRFVIDPNDLNLILWKAVRKGNLGMAYFALENGADVNRPVKNGTTPLFLSVLLNRPAMIRLLLEAKADGSIRNRRGETPLLRAAFRGFTHAAQLLLEKGSVDPDAANPKGWTPLHKAAFQGHVAVAAALLKHGADPNGLLKTQDGAFTPFKLAQWHRQEAIVRFFKKFGISA